ncbi:hypothetical protein ES705_17545 [subsurface metagenome]
MARVNSIKTLKQTKNFYVWELKRKESLTEGERERYLLALKSINEIIKKKEEPNKRVKRKTIFKGSY